MSLYLMCSPEKLVTLNHILDRIEPGWREQSARIDNAELAKARLESRLDSLAKPRGRSKIIRTEKHHELAEYEVIELAANSGAFDFHLELNYSTCLFSLELFFL